jgi:ribonuclease J
VTEIKILSGSRTIGGSFIKITDKDRVFVFDQGIRFDVLGRYFDRTVQPSGVMELRKLAVLPKEEWYKDATDVYVTHLHLDHLGVLSNVPPRIKVHLPGHSIYLEMKRKWEGSPTWLNLIPENYYLEVDDATPAIEDQNRVLPIPVSHSAYPAVAYFYFGSDKTILYTGDMRLHTFLDGKLFKTICKGPSLLDYIKSQPDLKIDLLIIEGTNFGSERTPILPNAAISLMEGIVTDCDLVIVTSHHLDVEFLIAVLNMAKRMGFRCYVSSEIVAKALQLSGQKFDVKVLEEYSKTPVFPTAPLSDVLEEKSLIITSYYDVVDLCRGLDETVLRNKQAVCILTEPEPSIEEMMEYNTVSRWLALYGVHTYRIRVSGHYYPFELNEILHHLKFKEILPVHTERPELMLTTIRSKHRK